jgi:lipopolysaccharide transport system ATP-binding protein
VHVAGNITGLLELGTGFNPELTGVKNIYMNALLIGMQKEEIDRKLRTIIEFTELGAFIEEPIKTYSSGMLMRLAFSIAIHAEPKAFVVDEALSVGDAYFQQKCMGKIREFRENGGSIIFVSHDLNAVKMLCDRALLLSHGSVIDEGSPEDVVNSYNFIIAKYQDKENKLVQSAEENHSHGTFEARIRKVSISGEKSKSDVVSSGEKAIITVEIEALKDFDDITTGIMIRDRFGQDIFGTNLFRNGITLRIQKGRRYLVNYTMHMNIGPGKYTISAAVHRNAVQENYRLHWVDRVASFEVSGNYGSFFVGVCKLYPDFEIIEV